MKQFSILFLAFALLLPIKNNAVTLEIDISPLLKSYEPDYPKQILGEVFVFGVMVGAVAILAYKLYSFLADPVKYSIDKSQVDLTLIVTAVTNGAFYNTNDARVLKIVDNIINDRPAYDGFNVGPKKSLSVIFSPNPSEHYAQVSPDYLAHTIPIIVKTNEPKTLLLFFNGNGECTGMQEWVYDTKLL